MDTNEIISDEFPIKIELIRGKVYYNGDLNLHTALCKADPDFNQIEFGTRVYVMMEVWKKMPITFMAVSIRDF